MQDQCRGLVLSSAECYHPVMEPTVALCMIVRDGQATLDRCLNSAAPAVDSIYLTDTGSKDETLSIAKKHGAYIRHFEWCDDFSAARNHSIQDIPEDWLLILDADDYFPLGEAARLRPYLKNSNALSIALRYSIMEGYSPALTRRVLRNHQGLCFTGIIHETIRGSFPPASSAPSQTEETDISLHHAGYTDTSLPQKLQRNLPLLQKEWARSAKDTDICQRLHIGKELAHTLIKTGKPDEGEKLLLDLVVDWPDAESENQFAAEALIALAWRHHETGRTEAAWQLCQSYKSKLSNQPAYQLQLGLSAFKVQHFPDALNALTTFEQRWLAGEVKIPVPLRYTGLALWDLQGQCYLQMGRMNDAARMFAKCLDAGGDAQEYKTKLHLARQFSA